MLGLRHLIPTSASTPHHGLPASNIKEDRRSAFHLTLSFFRILNNINGFHLALISSRENLLTNSYCSNTSLDRVDGIGLRSQLELSSVTKTP